MQYITKFNIGAFKFWGGAEAVIYHLQEDLDAFVSAQFLIKKAFEGTIPTADQINDYVWHHLEDDLWEMRWQQKLCAMERTNKL